MKNWSLDDFAVGDLVWAQIFSAVSGDLLTEGLAEIVRKDESRPRSKFYVTRNAFMLHFFNDDDRMAYPGEDHVRKATKLDKYLAGVYD